MPPGAARGPVFLGPRNCLRRQQKGELVARPFAPPGSRLAPAASLEEGRGRAPAPTLPSSPGGTSCAPRACSSPRRKD